MFHSQNLNENAHGEVIGKQVWHGRAWWHFTLRGRPYVLGWSWNFLRAFCHAYVEVSPTDEHTFSASIAVPYCALWIHLEAPWGMALNRWCRRADQKYGNSRRVGLAIHSGALWWDVWADTDEWRATDRKWRHGAWHPVDTLLGRNAVTWVSRETLSVAIPMPEGSYPAQAEVKVRVDKRPRWFARRREEVWLQMPDGGIPFPGKGENSWDCGMDGLCGIGGNSVEDAIGRAVSSVLRSRERYAGSREWVPPVRESDARC